MVIQPSELFIYLWTSPSSHLHALSYELSALSFLSSFSPPEVIQYVDSSREE